MPVQKKLKLVYLISSLGILLSIILFFLPGETLRSKIHILFADKEKLWLTNSSSNSFSSDYFSQKEEFEILSPVFHINKIYTSMMGPADIYNFKPDNRSESHIIWLTDYDIEVTDRSGKELLSKDFMCHNNIDLSIAGYLQHWDLKGRNGLFNNRLITLTQGQTELNLPEGFGIPLFSDDVISLTTQVLNHNIVNANMDVRHRIKMGFIRDENVKKNLKPLFKQTINILMEVDTTRNKTLSFTKAQDCRPAMASIAYIKQEKNGKSYTGHWIIKKGLDTIRYDVSDMLQLPFNTTLHFISVHVHPFCESLILRDLTNASTLFISHIKNFTTKTGMEKIDLYSSETGIKMNKDHRYELVCITNNTSAKEQDMMAVMILYFHDLEMEKKINNRNSGS